MSVDTSTNQSTRTFAVSTISDVDGLCSKCLQLLGTVSSPSIPIASSTDTNTTGIRVGVNVDRWFAGC